MQLVEIKKNTTGTGLLIENDGYISMDSKENKKLYESIKMNEGLEDGGWNIPKPFIVNAVFQKYGIENANGRIYPEDVLKREVEKYMEKIADRRGYGECYRPEAKILTETGWESLAEVKEGENILTLNPETNKIEIKPVLRKIEYEFNGNLINVAGRNINDLVTPGHKYVVYSNEKYLGSFTPCEIQSTLINDDENYIPIGSHDKFNEEKILLKELTFSEIKYSGTVMCVEVENHSWYVMDNNKYHWTSNCNHPEDSSINLSRVGMNIIELHWEGHTLVGQMEIPVTEGFRKLGIVSTTADEVANLLINNLKIGVSSRGVGSIEQRYGKYMVGDDYELICWDVVSDPSTPGSYVSFEKPELERYIESKTPEKNTLLEKLNKFNYWLIK